MPPAPTNDDVLAIVGLVLAIKKKEKCKKKHSEWCKEWLLKINKYSHTNLLNELKFAPKDWHNYLHMDENTYLELLSLVTPLIQKNDTIIPHERLTATLKFLATGTS